MSWIKKNHPIIHFKGVDTNEITQYKDYSLYLDNTTIKTLDNKSKFNNYIISKYGDKIITNHILDSTYALSNTFPEAYDSLGGIGLKYGNSPATATRIYHSNVVDKIWTSPALLEIKDLPIPKHIDFSFRYANAANVMCSFDIMFRTKYRLYSLIEVLDGWYPTSGKVIVTYNNYYDLHETFVDVHHSSIFISRKDLTKCFTDNETSGNLIIGSSKTVDGYDTNYVYIKKLNVLF